MNFQPRQFAGRMAQARKLLGLTTGAMASRLAWPEKKLVRYESGTKRPTTPPIGLTRPLAQKEKRKHG